MAILFVEDDDLGRATLADRLRRRGYEVLEAASGEAALEIAEGSVDLDAVIIDVELPGIDGVETYRRLCQTRPAIPAVVCSATLSPGARHPFFELGVRESCLLRKPCQFAELLAALGEVLQGRAK